MYLGTGTGLDIKLAYKIYISPSPVSGQRETYLPFIIRVRDTIVKRGHLSSKVLPHETPCQSLSNGGSRTAERLALITNFFELPS